MSEEKRWESQKDDAQVELVEIPTSIMLRSLHLFLQLFKDCIQQMIELFHEIEGGKIFLPII